MKKNNINLLITTFTASLVILFSGVGHLYAAGPAAVNLLSAGNYAIFSKTAIANPTGAGTVTGDIGTGPGVTSTAITGFALILPASSAFSTSALVTGKVYAFDYAVPTPATVTTASTDMLTAYNDAAGIPTPDFTELYSGDISGRTLVPGLYKWSNSVLVNTDVTLSGSASDVWIFQIAGDLTVAAKGDITTGIKVNLIGGAQASNVFWQVGGPTGATLGTYSTFEGNILSAKQIILQTGAVLNGRALAQTMVSLDHNTVTAPPAIAPCIGTVGTSVFVSTSGSDTNNDGSVDCPFATIQVAVNDAYTISGDTINVAAGEYTEVGQIVINKDLTIIGADKTTTIIKPAQDTSADFYGDSGTWILVNPGITFNLSKVTLDGTGRLITDAILSHGFGTIDGNIIKNIEYNQSGPDYSGAGIALFSATTTVSNNIFSGIGREGIFVAFSSTATITGNTYTGKGEGDWVDYAVEVGHNSTATISGNIISGNTGVADVDESTSAGIIVSDGNDIPGGTVSGATITNNTITGNTRGIEVGIDADEASVVVAHNNNLSGNIVTGITSTKPTVDATHNWWGNASGPSDPTSGDGSTPETNAGTGSAAVGAVNYSAWYIDAARTTLSTTEPVITLLGVTPNIGLGSTYSELGATAVDSIGNPVAVVISGSVNTAVVGSYPITYTAKDTFGNTATAIRTVNVVRTNNGEGGGGGGSVGVGVYHPAIPATPAIPGVSPAIPATPAVPAKKGEVLGEATFNFNRGLALGSRSDDVTELQNRLTAEGVYFGPITGYFGSLTAQGVKNLQKKYGLSQVGVVGPQTRAKLNSGVAVGTGTGNEIPGCAIGNKFNTTSGQACPAQASSGQGCAVGNKFSTTTGLSCPVQ